MVCRWSLRSPPTGEGTGPGRATCLREELQGNRAVDFAGRHKQQDSVSGVAVQERSGIFPEKWKISGERARCFMNVSLCFSGETLRFFCETSGESLKTGVPKKSPDYHDVSCVPLVFPSWHDLCLKTTFMIQWGGSVSCLFCSFIHSKRAFGL